jgi:hypothetical protein
VERAEGTAGGGDGDRLRFFASRDL